MDSDTLMKGKILAFKASISVWAQLLFHPSYAFILSAQDSCLILYLSESLFRILSASYRQNLLVTISYPVFNNPVLKNAAWALQNGMFCKMISFLWLCAFCTEKEKDSAREFLVVFGVFSCLEKLPVLKLYSFSWELQISGVWLSIGLWLTLKCKGMC